MKISGKLIKDYIIIKRPKDIGRLYDKSNFGSFVSKNNLQLNLIEGVFLFDEGKIKIKKGKDEIDFETLVSLAIKKIPHFEIKYLVFKDLKKRGHLIQIYEKDKSINFKKNKKYNQGSNKRRKSIVDGNC
jgi:tRNA-intron endonuclease